MDAIEPQKKAQEGVEGTRETTAERGVAGLHGFWRRDGIAVAGRRNVLLEIEAMRSHRTTLWIALDQGVDWFGWHGESLDSGYPLF